MLHPKTNAKGVHELDAQAVAALRRQRAHRPVRRKSDDPGEIAARAFELFTAGAELTDVVIATSVHPATIRELYAQWVVGLREGERQAEQRRDKAEEEAEATRREHERERWTQSLRRR